MCTSWNSNTLLVGMQSVAITFENSLEVSQNVIHIPTSQPNHPTPKCLPKRNEGMCPYKDMYMNIYSGFFFF